MAEILESTPLKREFKFEKSGKVIDLDDINPNLPAEEIIKFHSGNYPELTTATLEHEFKGHSSVYTAKTKIGTKG